jgi:hypothetical protein
MTAWAETAGTRQPGQNNREGQTGVNHGRTARTGQLGQDSRDRTAVRGSARTGPGHNTEYRMTRTLRNGRDS